MEVDQRLLRDLPCNILVRSKLLHLLRSGIEAVYVGVVVLVVVQLHNLAGDGRLEGAVVVCRWRVLSVRICTRVIRYTTIGRIRLHIQGRSGKVALLRVKVVLASAARLVAEGADALRAVRRALLFRSVLDIAIMIVFTVVLETLETKQRAIKVSMGGQTSVESHPQQLRRESFRNCGLKRHVVPKQ